MEAPPIPPELQRGYLSSDLPAVPGVVRECPEDFEVEEVPLYEPSGSGEHLYLWLEKRGIPTAEAVRRLARRLRVPRRVFGTAGLKDANALTRQWVSVAGVSDPDLRALEDENMRVLEARPHRNKLKPGHLQGNRFRLRIAGGAVGHEHATQVLARLKARGVANYFGLQRFGRERSTHRLGAALVAQDAEAFCELLLLGARRSQGEAAPDWSPSPRVSEAREAVLRGDHGAAAQAFPFSFTAELACCRSLARGHSPADALRAVAGKQRAFYVSAFQSLLFNTYLSRRLERVDAIEQGEVATLHRNGAAFLVTDAVAEQARCAAFEISPSGPQFGRKLLRPAEGSSAWADEEAVLAEHAPGLTAELNEALGAKPRGQRRGLRVPLSETQVEAQGEDLWVSFFLPKGCYATAVLEELFKRQTD